MLRFARDGHPKPIMDEGGKPHVFPTALEAQEAVTKHLLAYMNGDYQRWGETLSTAHSEAEALFPTLRPKAKVIVERRKVGA